MARLKTEFEKDDSSSSQESSSFVTANETQKTQKSFIKKYQPVAVQKGPKEERKLSSQNSSSEIGSDEEFIIATDFELELTGGELDLSNRPR